MRIVAKTTDNYTMKWTFYSVLSLIILIFLSSSITKVGPFGTVKSFIPISNETSFENTSYAIIFDGGSTGTRMHAFTFLYAKDNHMSLVDEYFEEVKPGLSSYADKPSKAAASIAYLLDKAMTVVPRQQWSQTSLALKATAGLRLLPAHSANAVLSVITDLFKTYPFSVQDDAVSIMDGTDEGLFGWFTVNLLGAFLDASKSTAVLDLGGGSTQVTFSPSDLDTIILSPKEYIIKKTIQNKQYILYTYSYLGLGLMSARFSIMRLSTFPSGDEDKSVDYLNSPCIHPATKLQWIHERKKYHVAGMKSGKYGFDSCYHLAVTFLNNTVDQPQNLKKQKIYGLSYYFDTASEMGIIDPKEGGIVTLAQYKAAASKACNMTNLKKPFLCLDATYITALLFHGLGLNKDTEIVLKKKVNGIETSWALGAAFSTISRK